MDKTAPHRRLNVLGLLCPLPILRAATTIKDMSTGQILEILSDDPGILEDLPEWCDETGHELVEIRTGDKSWTALVRKVE